MEKVTYKQFGIHLKVKDVRKSLTFYKRLGFTEVFAYGSDKFLSQFAQKLPIAPEKYNGVTFSLGEAKLKIADGHLAVKPHVFKEAITSSKVSAMLYVDSVDKVVKLAQGNGIPIAVPIREFPWGTREVVIKDPDGFVLVFIESETR